MEMMTSDYKQESEALQRFKKFVKLNTGNMATVMICALFFCTAFLVPGHRDDVTILEVLLNSMMAFLASTALNSLYNNKAIKDGLADKGVVDATEKHNARIDIITEENAIDELDLWCKEANRQNYRNQRARLLSKVGLSYSSCFTEDGEVKQIEIPVPRKEDLKKMGWRMWLLRKSTAKRQVKAYTKAMYLRLTELSAGELTGEGSNRNDPYNMGRGISEYKKQITATNTVSKIVLSLVVGYFTVTLIVNFSWAALLLRAIQIVMFLVFGFMQYLNTLDYMTVEYKSRLVRKGRLLLKFLSERKIQPAPVPAVDAGAERSDTNNDEVSGELGSPDHEGPGTGETDRKLHTPAS